MDEVDILIIGAGVIGLAIAKELAEEKNNLLLVEKNKSFGQETSSRNSEVIHGGMYYPCDTLKAKLCVEGRRLLYELCKKNNIPYKKTGKLIVAIEKEETSSLDELLKQGKNNGVEGLRLINQKELFSLEPNLKGISALYSPETGIIDSHRLMQYFLDSAKNNGAMIVFNSEAIAIEKISTGYKISVKNGAEITEIKAQAVINCAGLDSDMVAQMAGMDIKKCNYQLHYCKGQYFRVNGNKSRLIQNLVYPIPKPKRGGLGIHATLDLSGGLRLGPDDEYLDGRDKDYIVNSSKRPDFYNSARGFLPFLEEIELQPDTSGIRPKLQAQNEAFRDFVIKEEANRGLPGFFNLIGIESPGLTASPAIAKMLKNMIKGR